MIDRIIPHAKKFFEGAAYPPVIAATALISHLLALEIVFGTLIIVLTSAGIVITRSARPTVAPFAMIMCLLSRKHSPTTPSYSDFLTRPATIVIAIALAIILVAALIYLVLKTKLYKEIVLHPTNLTTALIIYATLLLTNGIFSGEWTVKNLLFVFIQAAALMLPYMLIYYGIPKQQSVKELSSYLSYTALCTALLIIAQMAVFYITEAKNVFTDNAIDKFSVSLGWGIQNVIGCILTVLIPLLFLGAMRNRFPILYFVTATLTYIVAIFTFSRNTLLFSTVAYVGCCIIGAIYAEQKRMFRLTIAAGISVGVLLFLIFHDNLLSVINHYVENGLYDNGRFTLWKEGLEGFKNNPIFGIGFFGYKGDYFQHIPAMPKLPHNTVIALLGAGGIIGMLAYVYYRTVSLIPFIKKPNVTKTMLGLSVLILLGQSLLDNFIFDIYPTFIYSIALAVVHRAERDNPKKANRLNSNITENKK